jgi:hypothetical protein
MKVHINIATRKHCFHYLVKEKNQQHFASSLFEDMIGYSWVAQKH